MYFQLNTCVVQFASQMLHQKMLRTDKAHMFSWRVWSLTNVESAWTLSNLSAREANAIVSSLSEHDRDKTFVHKKGWNEWKSIYSDESKFLLEPWPQRHDLPPLPMIQKNLMSVPEVRMVAKPDSQLSARGKNLRKYERFKITCPVEIMSGPSVFSTFTQDVSIGGMCLAQALPEWIAGYCSLILKCDDNKKIELICSVVEDQSNQKLRLEIDQTRMNPDYIEWLESIAKKFKQTG